MKTSSNLLKTYFDKEIPAPEKVAELLTFHSFEVEGVEKKTSDTVFDIKVLPDRAHYCLCHKGIAGELHAITSIPLHVHEYKDIKTSKVKDFSIKIEDNKLCRRYVGRRIEGVKVGPTPEWLKEYIEVLGGRSINNIVDATNFIMMDVGQPLHAFDADKVKGNITVRLAKKGETITTFDGKNVNLDEKCLLIADDAGPLAIAGIKGGNRAEVDENTKNIILESANFHPTETRRTSGRIGILTDASKRFENEITPELAMEAMIKLSELISDIGGNDMKMGEIVDEYPNKVKQSEFEFEPSSIEKRLGISIPLKEAKAILERMNIKVSELKDNKWQITIPFDRLDLTMSEDIVEEVGRIYGYEHIKGILPPKTDKKGDILPAYYISEKIRNTLVDQGFSEVSLYSLVSKGDIEVLKPLASDKAFVRKNLIDGMISCVEKNALNADLLGLDCIKVFEIGKIFSNDGERYSLAIGVCQIKKQKGISSKDILEGVIELLPYRCPTSVKVVGKSAVCEIDLDEIIKLFKADKNASYEELDLKPASNNHYNKISSYPFIARDIAIFVPESVSAQDVWQTIEKGIKDAGAEDMLVRHELFDTFKKENKTSFAFRMIFQSMDKTLSDNEVNTIMQKIYDGVKNSGWEVR